MQHDCPLLGIGYVHIGLLQQSSFELGDFSMPSPHEAAVVGGGAAILSQREGVGFVDEDEEGKIYGYSPHQQEETPLLGLDRGKKFKTEAREETKSILCWRKVLRYLHVPIVVLILAQSVCALWYIFVPGDRPAEHNDYVDPDSTEYADMTYVIGQAVAALFVLVLMLVALSVLAFPLSSAKDGVLSRLTVVVTTHFLSVIIWGFCAAYPSPSRVAIVYLAMVLCLVNLLLAMVCRVAAKKIKAFHSRFKSMRFFGRCITDYIQTVLHDPKAAAKLAEDTECTEGLAPIRRFERWLEVSHVRRQLRRKMNKGSRRFLLRFMVIFSLFTFGFLFEFSNTLSSRGELFTSTTLETMNENEEILKRFGERTATTKAVMIVLDGFWAPGRQHSEYKKWIDSIKDDALEYIIQVQLPSMSVPNWLTTITGVRPEISGVWGNLAIPETNFDTLFRQSKIHGLHRGISSSPWFSQLIKSQLPILEGDGTVAFEYEVTDMTPSAKEADERRGEALMNALRSKEKPYQFFLAHFSNIDLQGHCCGVDPRYNKRDTYNTAIADTMKILNEVIEELDEDTLLVVLADHGHKPKGGHGGHDAMLEMVPAVFYKKGSGLSTMSYDGPQFANKVWQNVDVVPTVAAFLGLPVPRQNQGVYIDSVMGLVDKDRRSNHLRDLFYQKREFVKAYMQTLNIAGGHMKDTIFTDNMDEVSDVEYRNGIVKLLSIYDEVREEALELRIVRNVLVTLAICIGVVVYFFWSLQVSTFASPSEVFDWMWCRRVCPPWSTDMKALLVCSLGTVLHVAGSVIAFRTCYYVYGYNIWDSTFLHYPTSFLVYMCFSLAPSCLSAFVIVRIYHWYVVEFPIRGRMNKVIFYAFYVPYYYMRCLFNISHANIVKMDFLYLCRHYMLICNVVAICVLWLHVSGYSFMVPPVFFIRLVDPVLWTYRFRVITVQLMLLPLLIMSGLNYLVFSSNFTDWRYHHYDIVYRLWIEKQLRQHRIGNEELFDLRDLLNVGLDVEDPKLIFSTVLSASKGDVDSDREGMDDHEPHPSAVTVT